ncbi:serine protease [Gordonia sp. OPL2]|uniref:serine protease n=1 Tax=Gordonia sp. OPL2 TaxID=2486274 RepID=UPI001655D6EF|nr:serine protease [Gordonia sp. OPL2]ROZ88084.1 serine protease [Gordonia sp. OPL2]
MNLTADHTPRRRALVTMLALLVGLGGLAFTPFASAAPAEATMVRVSDLPMGAEFGCTLGLAGTDADGHSIVTTARHCTSGRPGTPAYLDEQMTPSGHLVASSPMMTLDYAALRLRRETTVTQPVSVSAPPAVGAQVCKAGRVTGLSCGPVIEVTATTFTALIRVAWGDSGALATNTAGAAVGTVSRGRSGSLPADPIAAGTTLAASMVGISPPLPTVFIRADAIAADMAARIGFHTH